jgi:hypothetical protein
MHASGNNTRTPPRVAATYNSAADTYVKIILKYAIIYAIITATLFSLRDWMGKVKLSLSHQMMDDFKCPIYVRQNIRKPEQDETKQDIETRLEAENIDLCAQPTHNRSLPFTA